MPYFSHLSSFAMMMVAIVSAHSSSSLHHHHGGEWPDNFIFIESTANGGPEQIWLNIRTTSSVAVTYCTNFSTPVIVEYDLASNPTSWSFNATGNSTTYSMFSYTSPFINSAVMEGLLPGTSYIYRVSGPDSTWSESYTFTNPRSGPSTQNFRLAVIGDLGQTNNSLSTMTHVQQSRAEAIVIGGDLSYADSDGPRWDSFGRLIQPLSATMPINVCPGNHEVELSLPPTLAYDTRFSQMPFTPGSPDGPQYYSYNTGPVHIILLFSFTLYTPGSNQYNWLVKDLDQIDRSQTPWVVVVLHAPWYNSNTEHTNDGAGMKDAMEGLLFAAKVSVVFAGHVHAYERSAPVFNNTLTEGGITYVTIGDGGNREGLYTKWITPQPAWSAYRDAEYGHGMLVFVNATTASWEWHRDADVEKVVTDQVYITNPWSSA